MMAGFEMRYFGSGEKLWAGRYYNLNNILHWHYQCELIHVVHGNVTVRINNNYYHATEGECFFCDCNDMHYIAGEKNSITNVMIFESSIVADVVKNYSLCEPKIIHTRDVTNYFELIFWELQNKKKFYKEVAENYAMNMMIGIFRNEETQLKENRESIHTPLTRKLFDKINDEFAFITFEEAASISGYSEAYFSKVFKKLCGMTFSEYLNIIKIQNAVNMIKNRKKEISITEISLKCGFSTVRNFNRVFKDMTGYTPNTLPRDFVFNRELAISGKDDFDPTSAGSVLIL